MDPASDSDSSTAVDLDVEFVRSQFVAFGDPEVAQWAHFENAGGSYLPRQVTDRLHHLFTKAKVQPYSAWGPSKDAGEAMDRSKARIGATVNAAPGEIHLGPSTSQNTYVLAQALRAEMEDGDEIIVTNQDHEANIGAWRRLADTGITVREWSVEPDTGLLFVDDLAGLLNDRTKLVCVTHCSNIAATINPAADIVAMAHAADARVVLDGVSWAPHAWVDTKALDVDFYLTSLYKTYGPHLGLLYTRPDHLERITNQGHFFNADKPTYRLTPAGPAHAEVGAVEGILEFYDALHQHHFGHLNGTDAERTERVFSLFPAQEEAVMAPVIDVLNAKDDVRVIGAPVSDRSVRAPTIAFHSDSVASSAIVEKLLDHKVGASHGDFYAWRLMDALGLDQAEGVVRLSMLAYNTVEESTRAAQALDQLL